MKHKIKTYWWGVANNFGDMITPFILKEYKIRAEMASPENAEMVMVGSILTDLKKTFSGIILGSGLIKDTWEYKFPKATILAVRGEETRKRIGAGKNVVLGDPGLLIDKLIRVRKKKEYKIGIIPHYVDKNDSRILRICLRNKKHTKLIDIQKSPKKIIKEIDKCEGILSSSLHGIIAAHSLNIPAGWINLSDGVIGGGFKFKDYFTAFGCESVPPEEINGSENINELEQLLSPVPENVEKVKLNLEKVLINLRETLEN